MRKLGFIILGASLIFTFIVGMPKFNEAKDAKQNYMELESDVKENKMNLSSLQSEKESAEDNLTAIRNSSLSPKDFNTVSQNIEDIDGAEITKIAAYCYDESIEDSTMVEVGGIKEISQFENYGKITEPVEYQIKYKKAATVLKEIDNMKLYITSTSVNAKDDIITVSINFMGGE